MATPLPRDRKRQYLEIIMCMIALTKTRFFPSKKTPEIKAQMVVLHKHCGKSISVNFSQVGESGAEFHTFLQILHHKILTVFWEISLGGGG